MMGQYDHDEYTLPMCVHHAAAKHGCDHPDAVNKTWNHVKRCRLAIRALGSSLIPPLQGFLSMMQRQV
ncbi:hypothetical protein TNCV_1374941 [Trichonephila clavipes]|nr:hypothetical protein TNCV_1374941 [Trichonephila clavipes]